MYSKLNRMKLTSLLAGLFTVFSLLCLTAAVHAQESPTQTMGRAVGNGLIFGRRTNFVVYSNITSTHGFYYGYVTLAGRYYGKTWILSTIGITDPTFSDSVDPDTGDPLQNASAYGDLTLNGTPAQLVFNWQQDVFDTSQSSISWTVTAYQDDDLPGLPTGNLLFGSGSANDGSPIALSTGQVTVLLP